ncbi:MAG: WD40/YVTN/BNR-like repeat-containing protein, partial [Candidatus Micrarchaeaceae archaeon]
MRKGQLNRLAIRPILVMGLIILTGNPLHAQWKKLLTLRMLSPVNAVYFLDLAGPPRVGFLGADNGWYKTTDGGATWKHVGPAFPAFPRSIVFKDSMTGWTCWGHYVSKTTDQGETWRVDSLPGASLGNISYDSKTDGLFLGNNNDNLQYSSWDDGDTWQTRYIPWEASDAPYFLNADSGIRLDGAGNQETFDGGKTWKAFDGLQYYDFTSLYAVPGADIFLTLGESWGSLDYGMS